MATEAEILAWLDTAIQDVLTKGQHVSSQGDTYTKADLDKLMQWRIRISQQVDASTSSLLDRQKTVAPYRGG